MADDKVAIWGSGLKFGRKPANGELLIGNGQDMTMATLTAGAGASITNAAGAITISATGSGGTVTGVTASSPLASSGGATPNISLTGTVGVANGGTGLTSLTAGRIPFGAGTSAFGNSADLFWDSSNARLGLGTSSPSYELTIQNPNTGSSGLNRQVVLRTGDQTNFYRTSLTYVDSPSASGMFPGYSGGLYHEKGGSFATGTGLMVGTGANAGPLMFGTADTERMRIDASGNVEIGRASCRERVSSPV